MSWEENQNKGALPVRLPFTSFKDQPGSICSCWIGLFLLDAKEHSSLAIQSPCDCLSWTKCCIPCAYAQGHGRRDIFLFLFPYLLFIDQALRKALVDWDCSRSRPPHKTNRLSDPVTSFGHIGPSNYF